MQHFSNFIVMFVKITVYEKFNAHFYIPAFVLTIRIWAERKDNRQNHK